MQKKDSILSSNEMAQQKTPLFFIWLVLVDKEQKKTTGLMVVMLLVCQHRGKDKGIDKGAATKKTAENANKTERVHSEHKKQEPQRGERRREQKKQKTAQSVQKSKMSAQYASSILGVSLNATEQELKAAYRKLCKNWHPDRNQGSEEATKRKMQQINEAYKVMSQHIRSRVVPSRSEQSRQPRFEHLNLMQQANRIYNKLQQAIRDYDSAVDRLKVATAEKERIRNEYLRTPANDPNKQKLAQQLIMAETTCVACVNNKLRAQAYKEKCEREYKTFPIYVFQQKCCEYQRAA